MDDRVSFKVVAVNESDSVDLPRRIVNLFDADTITVDESAREVTVTGDQLQILASELWNRYTSSVLTPLLDSGRVPTVVAKPLVTPLVELLHKEELVYVTDLKKIGTDKLVDLYSQIQVLGFPPLSDLVGACIVEVLRKCRTKDEVFAAAGFEPPNATTEKPIYDAIFRTLGELSAERCTAAHNCVS